MALKTSNKQRSAEKAKAAQLQLEKNNQMTRNVFITCVILVCIFTLLI